MLPDVEMAHRRMKPGAIFLDGRDDKHESIWTARKPYETIWNHVDPFESCAYVPVVRCCHLQRLIGSSALWLTTGQSGIHGAGLRPVWWSSCDRWPGCQIPPVGRWNTIRRYIWVIISTPNMFITKQPLLTVNLSLWALLNPLYKCLPTQCLWILLEDGAAALRRLEPVDAGCWQLLNV